MAGLSKDGSEFPGSLKANFYLLIYLEIHRCGASGSMRACRAAGPGLYPGPEKFPG